MGLKLVRLVFELKGENSVERKDSLQNLVMFFLWH